MSFFVTRPPMPVPDIEEISTPCSAANLRTTGEDLANLSSSALAAARPLPFPPVTGRAARRGFATTGWAGCVGGGELFGGRRARDVLARRGFRGRLDARRDERDLGPHVHRSPSETRSFWSFPASGEGSSVFTLSVSTSAMGSSCSTSSPSPSASG
jgi:hypothetical protein